MQTQCNETVDTELYTLGQYTLIPGFQCDLMIGDVTLKEERIYANDV